MPYRLIRRAFTIFFLALSFAATSAFAQNKADLGEQLKRVMEWWPGQYDNHEQITRQSGGGLSALTSKPFFRVHSIVQRVESGALGENAISIRAYRNGNPSDIVRAESYALSIDEAQHAIRIKRYTQDARPVGDGCDIILHFVGGQFEGNVPPKTCAEQGSYADSQVVVGSAYYWTRDRRRDLKTDTVISEAAPGTAYGWFEQSRAHPFTCVILQSSDGDMKKATFFKTIKLDDQGGEADLAWPDGRLLTFSIQNRAFTSPPDREYPLFGIHEKGNPVPIAYAYAVDGSRRFGLNLGWFYIRCYADGEVNASEGHLNDIPN